MPLRLQYYLDELRHWRGDVAYRFGLRPRSQGDGFRRLGRVLVLGFATLGIIIALIVLTPARVVETVDVGATDTAATAVDGAVASGGNDAGGNEAVADEPQADEPEADEPQANEPEDVPQDGASALVANADADASAEPASLWTPREASEDLPDTWVLPMSGTTEADAQRPHLNYAAWDFVSAVGSEVVAMTSALVTQTSPDEGTCGGLVRLAAIDRGIELLYCHLSAVEVAEGDVVHPGDIVGLSGGDPGAAGAGSSDGEHLHLELRVNDELRCPQALMSRLLGASDGELSDLEADVAGLARWECIIAPEPDATPHPVAHHASGGGLSGSGASCGESLGFRRACD